ncbi:MAG: hypothetical protein MAG453_02185 [Calditrichaeota bacterium]|nr:hypothetical protein [Calditrichota bacterium]
MAKRRKGFFREGSRTSQYESNLCHREGHIMAETLLRVYGPYEVGWERIGGSSLNKNISREHADEFWSNVKQKSGGAPIWRKKGCYVFALKTARGAYKPYYVGKAGAEGGFEPEVFNPRNRGLYNDMLLRKGTRGTPHVFLVAKVGNDTRLDQNILNKLENYLIIHAKIRNKGLLNKHGTSLPDWRIKGVIRRRRGRPSVIAQTFKKMMGIE